MTDERRILKSLPGGRTDLPYSRAVVANGLVWVSGVGGEDLVTGALGESIEEQTRGAIENLRRILEAAGSGLHRVTWLQVGLAHPDDYARMNAEYVRHFPPNALPARATVRLGFESPGTRLVMACTALAGSGHP
ncbi:RidA family protein [Archangium sp.]|uniref:RidA family protein n=1 Tax=Archangium sp. TaxID=1872627 RepID=UPI002D22EC30|nr:RidA family protein [Archangium sp.]HYO51182.1 RidA family protein [Archangium sp.]